MADATGSGVRNISRLVFAWILLAAVSAPASNETRCNDDIARTAAGLRNAYAKVYTKCIKSPASCVVTTNRVIAKRDDLRRKVTDPGLACFEAVNSDGVSVSAFGPAGFCPERFTEPGLSYPITSLTELADCLVGAELWHARRLVDRLELRSGSQFFDYANKSEAKCIRNVYRSAIKAWKSGNKEVARCASDSAQPFACSLDVGPESRFTRSLDRIDRAASKCKSATGVVGELSGDVLRRCHRYIDEPQDLVVCVREATVCVTCRDMNVVFGLGQDCAALAGSRTCEGEGRDVPVGTMAVTNAGDDTVTYYDPDGGHLFGDLAASSFGVGADPGSAVFNELTNTLFVANRSDDSVTLLTGASGAYVGGSLIASTVGVGVDPVAVALNKDQGLLYVANRGSNSVTILDALYGDYAFGGLAASTIAVGSMPSGIAFSDETELVFVTNEGDDTIVVLESDGSYFGGGLGAATIPTLRAPVDVRRLGDDGALSQSIAVASAVDSAIAYHDAATGSPAYGTLAASMVSLTSPPTRLGSPAYPPASGNGASVVGFAGLNIVSSTDDTLTSLIHGGVFREPVLATGASPVAAGGHDETVDVFVVEATGEVLQRYAPGNAQVRSRTEGAIQNALFNVDLQTIAVSQANSTVYLLNSGSSSVTYIDAVTGAYKFGSFAASTFTVDSEPTNVAVSDANNLIYIAHDDGETVVYLDATTGAYVGGSLAAASIAIHRIPGAIAVDETAGRVFVSGWDAGTSVVTWLDAASPAYIGGSLAAASVSTAVIANDFAVDEADGRVYAAATDLVYLNSASPGYTFGTLGASSFASDRSLLALELNASTGTIYAATDAGLRYFDAATGASVPGTTTDEYVDSLAADPANGLLYGGRDAVVTDLLTIFDFVGTTGYASGAVETSQARVHGASQLAYDTATGILWCEGVGQTPGALAVDTVDFGYAFGDSSPVSSAATGSMPTSLAVSE